MKESGMKTTLQRWQQQLFLAAKRGKQYIPAILLLALPSIAMATGTGGRVGSRHPRPHHCACNGLGRHRIRDRTPKHHGLCDGPGGRYWPVLRTLCHSVDHGRFPVRTTVGGLAPITSLSSLSVSKHV